MAASRGRGCPLPHCRRFYGVAGERRLPEHEATWLGGYAGSRPVRIGNDAHRQLQLDVYGEVLDALYGARRLGIGPDRWAWSLEQSLLDTLEGRWREPDEGMWEIRGPRQQLTHSKVMAWVAFDRAINPSRVLGSTAPSIAGERFKRRSTQRYARAATTARGTPSPKSLAVPSSTRAC